MKNKEIPGWADAVEGAKKVFSSVEDEAWEAAGESEAPTNKFFIFGPNDVYMVACRTGKVRLRNGERVKG